LPDASPAPDAATRGTVHVTVLDPSGTGAPAVGASVVFLDPDGTLVKRAATDTGGKADADLLPGGSVTSVALQTSAYQIQSVLAVQPGDDLILGVKTPDTMAIGNVTVSFPAYTQVTPASYTVGGPCGTGSSFPPPAGGPPPASVTLSFNNTCKLDTMEIVVQANDGNGNPIAVIGKTGLPFVVNGTATVTGTYQAPRTFTGSYTNVNANITSLGMTRTVPDGFGLSASPPIAAPPAATQVMTVAGVIGSSALIDTQLAIASRARQIVRQSISGSAASYGLDLSTTLLPWLGTPTFDAASGKLLVPTDPTGTTTAAPDLVRLAATYRRTDPVSGAQTSFTWTVFSPVAADLVLPRLPPEVGSVMPTSTDTVTITGFSLESDAVAGYDAVRHDLNAAFFQLTSSRPPGTTLRAAISPINLR
jgi:hypothetical protein